LSALDILQSTCDEVIDSEESCEHLARPLRHDSSYTNQETSFEVLQTSQLRTRILYVWSIWHGTYADSGGHGGAKSRMWVLPKERAGYLH
jgi:hypothetical protein